MNNKQSNCMLSLFLSLLVSACAQNEDSNQTISDPPPPPAQLVQCSAHKADFEANVWPILNTQCFSCHELDKVNSDLNLVGQSTSADFVAINFSEFKNVAIKKDANGTSLLLTKPTNSNNDHSGGQLFTTNSSEYTIFTDMVTRLASCEDTVLNLTGVVLNTPYEQLRKNTLSLAGRLPTAAEIGTVEAVSDNESLLTTTLDSITDQVLTEDTFYTHLKEIFNDFYLLNAYPGNSALSQFDLNNFTNKAYFDDATLTAQGYTDVNDRNLIRSNAGYGLAQAPLELIAHVVKNNRPFTEILTANYILVNPYSATLYSANINASFNFKYGDAATLHDANDFREAVLTDANARTYPHAGILSSLTFLNRYPSTNTNRNRARSRVTFLYFLDTDVQGLADRAGLNLDDVKGDFPPLEDPQCKACHDTVDPVAGLYKNWTNRGLFSGNYTNWFSERNPPQMLSPGYTMDIADSLPGEQSATALQWLAVRITNDSRFALSVVKILFKGITGQDVPQDSLFVETLKYNFVDSGYNLKTLIKDIINSIYFKANNLGSQEKASDYTEIGMGHLVTPEQLQRKISAVTGGYNWTSPSNKTLTDLTTYNLLYGGIDSLNVTGRTTDPTALITGIQERIALQSSCQAVPVDFNKTTANRVLFPLVETTDTPNTALGAIKIKQNIQHLYQQLLGEVLALDSTEIQRTYELFVAVRTLIPTEEIPIDCRGNLATDNPVRMDNDKTVRPWMSVVAHLLSDYRFLYE